MKSSSFAAALVLSLLTVNASGAEPLTLALKSGNEVRRAFEANPSLKTTDAASELATVLHAGQRAFEWIKVINQARPAGQKPLSYSDPSTTTNPTMEHPKIYNAAIALQMYADISAKMPLAYRTLIEGSMPLPSTAPVNDADFIALGLKTTMAYDTGVRWIMMQDYLSYYETQKVADVRGYYFFANLVDRDIKLKDFANLLPIVQQQFNEWLIDLCMNGEDPTAFDLAACEKEVQQNETAGTLPAYYASKVAHAQKLWDSFYTLDDESIRTDLTWTSKEPDVLHYPFLQPVNPVTLAYLRDNVEDEWKLGSWHLKLDFTTQDSSPALSRLEYQPNITPHEEPNKIVMDENEPLTEYLTQWTIRHEFGHLLGFKDCYVEFYDAKAKVMINYPLDPSNLMCSRRGHLQRQHVDVLKAAYFKN
jgi:hypothetical protein